MMSRRRRGKNQTARAGQAEKGVEGKGIPAPPSLSAAAEFRFRFAKCAVRKRGVVFAPPSRAHTTLNSLVKIKEKMYSNNRFEIQVFIILLYHTIIIQVWHKRIKSARI